MRKASPAANVQANLAEAFAKVDATTGKRLELLKGKYNEIASAAAGTPSATPRQLPLIKGAGADNGPQMESPPAPQPPSGGPPTTKSGRYFIEFANCKDKEEFRTLRERVAKAGRVVDSGQGTALDPEAAWVEVAMRGEDTRSIILKVGEIDTTKRVERLIEVAPGEGHLQAKQLALFGKAGNSDA